LVISASRSRVRRFSGRWRSRLARLFGFGSHRTPDDFDSHLQTEIGLDHTIMDAAGNPAALLVCRLGGPAVDQAYILENRDNLIHDLFEKRSICGVESCGTAAYQANLT
jgi:hypothetical protein